MPGEEAQLLDAFALPVYSAGCMKPLEPPDSHHLRAAQGWLELGNYLEAGEELERIAPPLRSHDDVIEVRWRVHAQARNWHACVEIAAAVIELDPGNSSAWIHRAYALHELKRTQEAYDSLLPAAKQFSEVWMILYNLACYCAQLGRLDEGRGWIKQAMAIDKRAVKQAAMDDPDLEPLRESTSGTLWDITK